MTRSRWRPLIAWGGFLLLAAAPQSDPDLSEYRTVRTAATREVAPPRAGRPGETGFLGVSLRKGEDGKLVVEEVQPDSPAEKAGIRKGDVLASMGGEPVKAPERFRESLQAKGPGEAVELTLRRGSETIESQVTLSATSRPRIMGVRRLYLGVVLGEARPGEGVPIEEVAPNSPASSAGFKAGDQIFQIDGLDFTNPTRLTDLLGEKKPGDELEVLVHRGKEEITLKPKVALDPAQGRPGASGRAGGQGPMAIELWKKPVFRVAVIGIEFPDIKANSKVSMKDWEEALLSSGTYHDRKNATDDPAQGSLNDYFREQSGGAFRLEGKAFERIEVGKKRADYILGSGTTNITAVLVEALDKIAARDGKDALKDFDGFFFLYAGEQARGNRGGVYYPHAGMIRSFQSKRWPYVFIPEGGSHATPVGAFAKEFCQMLGLPDLAARTEDRGSEGLGAWCALSNPMKAARPQHMGAWAKEKLGWTKPAVIDPTVYQKLILSPIAESPGECFKVLVRSDGSEYLLLENRARKGFDERLPGEGLLIWRVVHDRPVLEESHGVEGPSGPITHPESVPYPSATNHAFTPETTPSSRSPLGGGLPVSITNIRRLSDGRITFHIGYEYR